MEASPPASRVDLARALRQTAITALIAFGLLLPLIGFNTVQNIHNELVLETRWPLLAALVAIVATGRLLWGILPRQRLKRALTAYFGSPSRLAVTAAACCMIAILAQFTLGATAEPHTALRASLMAIVVFGA